jgi:beta-lactamase superfamily II metal-dependent hydrolase
LVQTKEKKRASLEVCFLDIGQGDATLINYLNNYQILIDGGPKGKDVLTEISKNMPTFDQKIELVILTHPDRDHLTGLVEVLKNYQVDLFLDNGQTTDDEVWQELQRVIKDKGIRKETLLEGSKIKLGNDLSLDIFNPDIIEENGKDKNDFSVVFRMNFGINSFLFTGDAEFKTEGDMIYDQEHLDTDWLKVGHHGSKGATSEVFLEKVTPDYAVISAGKDNSYGHPTEEVLERLKTAGAEIFRTDRQGTIKVKCKNKEEECSVLSVY